jgi:hypothetical protein
LLVGLPSAEEEASLAMALGPTSRLIALKKPGPATLAAIAEEIAAAFRPSLTGDGIRTPCTVFVATARAP